jgi:hypothetical protein
LETPTPFISKKFESLTIVINVNKKKFLLTNIYRPPTPLPGVSSSEQLEDFVLTMDQILSNFSNMTIPTIILTDSNINLLKLRDNPITEQFANTVHSNGFLFVQCKATRQNQGHLALIDHIITNHKFSQVSSGVLIEDLSDHFPNFIQLPLVCAKPKCDSTATRAFTPSNITTFQNNLNNTNWNEVYACNDVDAAYDIFWTKFNNQFSTSFPLTKVRLNRNVNKVNDYMTTGLLVSRSNKNQLHKISITNPTPANMTKYKVFRNIYNSLIRLSKKMYFATNLKLHKRNPRKTWDLLREAMGGQKTTSKITEIHDGNNIVTEPADIAEQFNAFFTTAGNKIANSIPHSNVDPLSYINFTNPPPTLSFTILVPPK